MQQNLLNFTKHVLNIFQLSMELYDTKNEKVLWSERWQKDWEEIPQVRDLLSDNILKILRVDHDSSNPVHVSNPEAYEYYLKAKHKYEKTVEIPQQQGNI